MTKRKIDTCRHADLDWPWPICTGPSHPDIGCEDGATLVIDETDCEVCGMFEQKGEAE